MLRGDRGRAVEPRCRLFHLAHVDVRHRGTAGREELERADLRISPRVRVRLYARESAETGITFARANTRTP